MSHTPDSIDIVFTTTCKNVVNSTCENDTNTFFLDKRVYFSMELGKISIPLSIKIEVVKFPENRVVKSQTFNIPDPSTLGFSSWFGYSIIAWFDNLPAGNYQITPIVGGTRRTGSTTGGEGTTLTQRSFTVLSTKAPINGDDQVIASCPDQAGMFKVNCGNSSAVFQDECGQCWANEISQPPPDVPTNCPDQVGMVKVSCSNSLAVFQDNCRQCWANKTSPTPIPTPTPDPPPTNKCADQLGMSKVNCSDPDAIFQDECGQCWAIMTGTPPLSKKVLELDIIPFLPNAINVLNIDTMFSTVFNFLPLGWNIENIEITNSKIRIIFVEEGTPALLLFLPQIIAGLKVLLITIGIIITAWKLLDFLTEREETAQIETRADIADLIESNKDQLIGAIDALNISDDAKADLITKILAGDVDALIGGTDGTRTLEDTILIIAIIAVAGLIGYAVITQKR